MSNYDLFVMNAEGEIVSSRRLVADSDIEALTLARQYLVEGHKHEVWEGERSVGEPMPSD
jgi:hypothetical protein